MNNNNKAPNIVALGGGTGLSTMLRGLKKLTPNITAIVTVSDNGGGSGILREQMKMLPPGDIRNCLVALANTEPIMEELLQYRFKDGNLAGQSFGNLFLAALSEISGSFEKAVRVTENVLAITGKVIPVTLEEVNLEATFHNGDVLIGEEQIVAYSKTTGRQIKEITLCPQDPAPMPDAISAIEEADAIILGPGSLYTSIIPNLLVNNIPQAIAKSSAKIICICNIMTQPGETTGFGACEHLEELEKYLGEGIIDTIIINSEEVPQELLKLYLQDGANTIHYEYSKFKDKKIRVVKSPVMKIHGDRHIIRHDPDKLAKVIMEQIDFKSSL